MDNTGFELTPSSTEGSTASLTFPFSSDELQTNLSTDLPLQAKEFELLSFSEATLQDEEENFAETFAQIPFLLRKDPYLQGVPQTSLGKAFVLHPLPLPRNFWIAHEKRGSSQEVPGALSQRIAGRVSANISSLENFQELLSNETSTNRGTESSEPTFNSDKKEKLGFIGFFEASSLKAAQALIQAATEFLKQHGATRIIGPVNFNTWLSYRFAIKPQGEGPGDSPQFSWEPVQPPEYPRWFEALGFSVAARYHTDGLNGLEGVLEGTRQDFERCLAMGYRLRPFQNDLLLSQEVPLLYEISMRSFEKNFLFEKVPYAYFKQLYVPFANKADLSLGRFVCDPQGKEVAFFFNFQDGPYLISKTVGVLPEHRGKGLSNAALHSAVQDALSRGLQYSVMALVKSGLQSESYGKKQGSLWRHEYVLYQKEVI